MENAIGAQTQKNIHTHIQMHTDVIVVVLVRKNKSFVGPSRVVRGGT